MVVAARHLLAGVRHHEREQEPRLLRAYDRGWKKYTERQKQQRERESQPALPWQEPSIPAAERG
jgi:hypothetical protein